MPVAAAGQLGSDKLGVGRSKARYGSDTSTPIVEGDLFSRYTVVSKKGEGTFSEVLECRSRDPNSPDAVAVKKLKTKYPHIMTANKNREIQAMRRLAHHPNVIRMKEIIFEPKSGCLYIILDLMEMNLYEYMKGKRQMIAENRVRYFMLQLIDALRYIHKLGIFHRDVKPENILVKGDTLKLADFGSCRSREAKQPFTEYISTRWYRAPECLLTDGYYDYKMDVWSTGCVFFEISRLTPLFPGTNEIDQIDKIHRLLGTPAPETLAKFKRSRSMQFNFPARGRDEDTLNRLTDQMPRDAVHLMLAMLEYDPDKRVTMDECLRHSYIITLVEKLKRKKEERLLRQASPAESSPGRKPSPTKQARITPDRVMQINQKHLPVHGDKTIRSVDPRTNHKLSQFSKPGQKGKSTSLTNLTQLSPAHSPTHKMLGSISPLGKRPRLAHHIVNHSRLPLVYQPTYQGSLHSPTHAIPAFDRKYNPYNSLLPQLRDR